VARVAPYSSRRHSQDFGGPRERDFAKLNLHLGIFEQPAKKHFSATAKEQLVKPNPIVRLTRLLFSDKVPEIPKPGEISLLGAERSVPKSQGIPHLSLKRNAS